MSRVVMYVLNDVRLDSRVRREAATLSAVGHQVTVIGTRSAARADLEDQETVDGFRVVRIELPGSWPGRWRWVVQPWSLRRSAVGRLNRSMHAGPRRWPDLLPAGADLLLAAALSGLRHAGRLLAALRGDRDRSGAPVYPPEGVRWLIWWRSSLRDWSREAVRAAPAADVHHAHDLTALPAALAGARRDRALLIYDSHDIFLDAGANATRPGWARRVVALLERRWSGHAAALVTVNEAYAAVLGRRLQPRRIVVVRNCPPRWAPPAGGGNLLRKAARIPRGAPIVLYHGGLTAHRGIEQLAGALLQPGLRRAHVVLMGYGHGTATYAALADEPRFEGRCHVLPAVPPDELLSWVAGADVAAIPLQHSTLNHYLCTPNKLFEAIAAGVPAVVSDFPMMRRVILDDPLGPLGATCDPQSPRAIADALVAIIGQPPGHRAALRRRCLDAAHERWNWELESARLVALYDRLGAAPALP